jgi:cullin 4
MSSLSILSTLDLYENFDKALVNSTEEYYVAEVEKLSHTMSPEEYIQHLDARVLQEEQRCDRFFERRSKKTVMSVVKECLIARDADALIDRSFTDLVKGNDIESLKTLYRLLNLVDKISPMRSKWAQYIKVFPSPYFTNDRIPEWN